MIPIKLPYKLVIMFNALFSVMGQEEYSLAELMQLVGLTHRATFQKNYLNPAIEAYLIERTIPDKTKSPKQKYRLRP